MFRFQLAVSLDGFVAGPDQSEETPLGVGGLELQGGEVYASTLVVEEAQSNVGATVMGRKMFGGRARPLERGSSLERLVG